jgi:hypothetical protein
MRLEAGNPYQKGRVSTVDLLELTNSDQVLYIQKTNFFIFLTKQAILSGVYAMAEIALS